MTATYVFKGISEAERSLNTCLPLFFDTETVGLYGEVALAQFFQEGLTDVILCKKPDPQELIEMLKKFNFVAQNSHYDITTLQLQSGSTGWTPSNFDDTLYLARLHFPKAEKFDLESLTKLVLGYSLYEQSGISKKEMQKAKWDVPLTDLKYKDQLIYAAIDVVALKAVYDVVKEQKDHFLYKLDKKILSYCFDFQHNGMFVNKKIANTQLNNNLAEIQKDPCPINVNSYKQVREYINSTQSDASGLIRLSLEGNTKAAQVYKERKLLKQNSFIKKFMTINSRVYGKFQPSARSGRFTCKDQNLQQTPRKLKHLFEAPRGKVLIYADYAQIELRCITAISGEARMEALFREGKDLHAYTAKMLFGEEFTEDQRFIAKTANFGLLYGAGPAVFKEILLKSEPPLNLRDDQVYSVVNKWKMLWPAIIRWQRAGISAWENNLTWVTPLGREYIGNRLTDHLNICNQGFAAEIAKLAVHKMYKGIKQGQGKLVNFVHDSYIIECDDSPKVYKPVVNVVANAMKAAWFACLTSGKSLKIRDLPMPVDVYVGKNLAGIEKKPIYSFKLPGDKDV